MKKRYNISAVLFVLLIIVASVSGCNSKDADTSDVSELKETVVEDTSQQNIVDNENYTILDFVGQKPIENVKSYTYMEDTKEISIELIDGESSIFLGKDHPNGIRIQLVQGDKAVLVELTPAEVLDEFGDFADIENYVMQVGTYDFNDDKVDELIITIGDNLINGQVWIYSYHHVDDILKINPFHLELTTSFQDEIWVEKDRLMIPYGSQGLYEEYIWDENGFLKNM